MNNSFHAAQRQMLQAELAIDHANKLINQKQYKLAKEYLKLKSVEFAISTYYGESTYKTLLDLTKNS